MIRESRIIAEWFHGPQVRKYTGVPYVLHTQAVAKTVVSLGIGRVAIAAAHLHDVLEDTFAKPDTLREALVRFGISVPYAHLIVNRVIDLTDVFVDPAFGNRAKRKEAERARLAMIHEESMIVKLADLIDNAQDIIENDKNFAKVFLKEARLTLGVIGHAHRGLAIRLDSILTAHGF